MVSGELLQMTSSFMDNGELFKGINPTYIVLIPKESVIAVLSNIHLISLPTSLYKFVAKVLAGKLKKVLDFVISGHQYAFIQNRLIYDSVLVAQECIHSRDTSGEPGVIIKLDMEKAYNKVE
ncbi:uncharacterized protein LOC105420679 [Amborella trichopoda]|uniref:uncharacterized protein LOC105420679 n=1 Tax=Amborella trichopoda TaxID=13333 RepID=UPI0005D3BA20|nr:uncharacterized protein LOC105420679 [Amborella trichopoda]|eukprot:XP_011623536.1 uncharacterized protein LOC105420679 [Amborella trichopoda]